MSRITFEFHPGDLPERYIMTADGQCLEPEIMHGQKLIFSARERYKPGDLVAIFKRREFTMSGDHQVIVKKLIMAPRAEYWTDPANFRSSNLGASVIVRMLNPGYVLQFDPDTLLGIHKCVGPAPENQAMHTVDEGWISQKATERRQRKAAMEPS